MNADFDPECLGSLHVDETLPELLEIPDLLEIPALETKTPSSLTLPTQASAPHLVHQAPGRQESIPQGKVHACTAGCGPLVCLSRFPACVGFEVLETAAASCPHPHARSIRAPKYRIPAQPHFWNSRNKKRQVLIMLALGT